MKENNISPNKLVLIMMFLINVVIIRDGSLLDNRLYFFLIGTMPVLFYFIFNRRGRTF
jgi:hypothetical protein